MFYVATLISRPDRPAVTEELAQKAARYLPHGFVVLGFWNNGIRHPMGRFAINVPDDVKGKKMRVIESPLHIALWGMLGANPTPLPAPEIYNALQTGVIDFLDNSKSSYLALRFYEVAPYFTDLGHIYSYGAFSFSKLYWDKLTPEQQTILRQEAAPAIVYQDQAETTGDEAALAKTVTMGAKVTKPDHAPWVAAMKPFWEISDAEIKKCLAATTWHPSMTEYFPGGGWSTRFRTRGGMPVTICRLNLVKGLGPALQIAEGEPIELPDKVHAVLDERTNPTWPTTWFAPHTTGNGAFRDVYTVMNNWGANHCSMSYGHVGADLISLASMLRIPVYMHNVPEEKVFRPHAWSAFGTADREGADFRACANFGPLYGAKV